jgi:SpoVK/Ycf46/Vps4 family AAA+-type ATPase
LEHSKPTGFIVGTSNLPKHLDDALWRRFDATIAFNAPKRSVLRRFVRDFASAKAFSFPMSVMNRAAAADSFAAAEAVLTADMRRQALAIR